MLDITKKCIAGIKTYFKDTNGKKAVIGISGGKDSSVVAALCVNALGKENVFGVLMPNGLQSDLNDAKRLCKFLEIRYDVVNIVNAYSDLIFNVERVLYDIHFDIHRCNVSEQTKINLAPRIRMSVLYAIAQTFNKGRVINTTNRCEAFVGYGTLWGDTVGDFAPLSNLLVSEVVAIGKDLGLPTELVEKTPSDGLSGKSDEENLGVTYDNIEEYIKCNGIYHEKTKQIPKYWTKIKELHEKSEFKRNMINVPNIKFEE